MPVIEVVLTNTFSGKQFTRVALADTGAGSNLAGFEIVFDRNDCLQCGGLSMPPIKLSGAFVGTFPICMVRVQIPQIGFDRVVPVAGVPQLPAGIEAIAGFRFLNRFTYGNFGDPNQFGLEV
jgi:hypothetical protein